MLNYTTTIAVDKTVAEVSRLLAKAGAASVSTHYDEKGQAAGLGFSLRTPHGVREFSLPVAISGVHGVLKREEALGKFKATRRAAGTFSSPEHAERVAWRVAKDWLEAQLALIEAQMATLDQVMLPYVVARADGATLYQVYREREQAAIEGGAL